MESLGLQPPIYLVYLAENQEECFPGCGNCSWVYLYYIYCRDGESSGDGQIPNQKILGIWGFHGELIPINFTEISWNVCYNWEAGNLGAFNKRNMNVKNEQSSMLKAMLKQN